MPAAKRENAKRTKKAAAVPEPAVSATKKAAAPKSNDARERFVVLFRHGMATDRALDTPDAERGLTAEGHEKMKRSARGLAEVFTKADALMSSPLVRAVQTALWLTKAYKDRLKVQTTEALSPGASPQDVVGMLAKLEASRVVLVGHEPNLTELAAFLSGGGESFRADLGKAGAIGIRIDETGRGTLEWMLTPKMLRRLG